MVIRVALNLRYNQDMSLNLPELDSANESYPRNALERLGYMRFDSKEEQAEYIQTQIDQAQIILKDFVDQSRERGSSDDEITDLIKKGILAGDLPQLAEQAEPREEGTKLILIVNKLPPEIQQEIEVKLEDDHVRVLAPLPGDQNMNVQLGWIAELRDSRQTLTPETFAPGLANSPTHNARLIKEIVRAVHVQRPKSE